MAPPPPPASLPLLRVKMLPPSPGLAVLTRARLLDRLRGSLEHPDRRGSLVMAGAGYGKTTLVAEFIRSAGIDAVWYSLDPSDRDPSIFFRYVIEGVRERCAEFGRLAEGLLDDAPLLHDGVERFVDVLINDATEALSARTILVLDDFQHLDGSESILRAVRRLLAYAPDSLHLVLISRTVPDLGVSRLRTTGVLEVIDREDLRFSEEDTRGLLTEVLGVRLEPAAVKELQERTQGWVTALQLLRQESLQAAGAARPEAETIFARTEAEIFEYFSEGVLAGEAEEVRRFLLRSSLPAILEPEICARVLDDLPVRGLLEGLVRRNLFIVPLAGRADGFTYHPLFRDFLVRKLTQTEGESEVSRLHRRYAACFEERGEVAPALHHYLQGRDPDAVRVLLVRQGPTLLQHGLLETVRLACGAVRSSGTAGPPIDLLQGEVARIEGDYPAAVRFYESVLDAGSLSPRERAEALEGLAYVELKRGDLPAAEKHAGEALRLSDEAELPLRARILNTMSIAEYRSGRYEAAVDGWQKALDLARRAGEPALVRKVAHNLGLPHGMRGDYEKALGYFRMLLKPESGEESTPAPDHATASLNVARIEILKGEHKSAADHLDDAMEIARKYRLKALRGDVLEAQGNLFREMGDAEAAREKYAGARRIFTELGLGELAEGLEEEEVHLRLLEGSPGEALRLAEDILQRARSGGAGGERLASALLGLGRARLASGETVPGGAPTAAELLLAARDEYRRLSFRFQEAEAELLRADALARAGDASSAAAAAAAAVGLAARRGYQHLIRSVATRSEPLLKCLAALPDAARMLEGMAPGTAEVASSMADSALSGPDLTINMLGTVEVYRDASRKIPASAWTLKRALKILCYLAASRDHRATKDRITDTFWGEVRASIIQKNFHPTISYLRKALNMSHTVTKNFVLFEKGAYRLNPAYRYRIDIEVFEAALTRARGRAREGDRRGALAAHREALSLYRGEFLEEEYDEWVEGPRAHYAGMAAGCLQEAGALYVEEGDTESALVCYERLVGMDPLGEEPSCRLMELLGRSGNRAGVEREFARLSESLMKDLDLEPLPETRGVYEKALSGRGGQAGRKSPR